jgi:hypothetical protein
MKNLHAYFLNNNSKVIHKWLHYFDIYEKHFKRFTDKRVLIFEIGVAGGGSLEMWKHYFGENAIIVGIDINPQCKAHESENVYVEIGYQSDVNFLNHLILKYGQPDIVIDDGSHSMIDLISTFNFLYYQTKENGVYFVEDLHTCYWNEYGGAAFKSDTFIEFSKKHIDELNAYHSRGVIKPTEITKTTQCISIYDSVIVYEKRRQSKKFDIQTGHVENL